MALEKKKRKKPFLYIIRKKALGDVLWMEPVIALLAAEYRQIIVISHYYKIFDNYPLRNVSFRRKWNWIDKFYIKHLAPRFFKNYGVMQLDMAYENTPQMHVLRAYFTTAGYPNHALRYPVLYLSEKEKMVPRPNPYVLFHLDPPSTLLNYRNAHGIDWQTVIDHVFKLGFEPIVISDNNLGSKYGVKTIAPPLRELVSYINGCSMLIGLDSGPSQIAASLKKPTVIFFGSVNPWFRHLESGFNGVIMQKPCEFAGCYHEVIDHQGKTCQLVGDAGIPKCCNFSTMECIVAVDKCFAKNA